MEKEKIINIKGSTRFLLEQTLTRKVFENLKKNTEYKFICYIGVKKNM